MASEPPQSGPLAQVDLRRVSVLFGSVLDRPTVPLSEHVPLVIPAQDSRRVAIVVDGVGSSTAKLLVGGILPCLEEQGFATCVFNYRGMRARFYQPADTVLTRFEALVEFLSEYIAYYRAAECLVLVGYSFGGIIVSQWLFQQGSRISDLPGFRGSCLIASPIRLRPTQVHYSREHETLADARGHIQTRLAGYTALPDVVPAIASMILIRCQRDGLLAEHAYSFLDLPLEDRPIETTLPFGHVDIIQRAELQAPLAEAVNALCERRYPQLPPALAES